jgi:hypothetical protein
MAYDNLALSLLFFALILHAALAAVDVLLNHELLVQLPSHHGASTEQWLHSIRECIFTLIFIAIAWGQWHGLACWIVFALLAIELSISLIDTIVEVETRKLPVSERINHVFLYVNFGVICLLFSFVSADWLSQSTSVRFVHNGVLSWFLTLAACGSFFFCIRDAKAAMRLR